MWQTGAAATALSVFCAGSNLLQENTLPEKPNFGR
jgi:hypothetical protein